jgi:hypothetical protein
LHGYCAFNGIDHRGKLEQHVEGTGDAYRVVLLRPVEAINMPKNAIEI